MGFPENVRAVLYLRVSTEAQELDGQERELRSECLRRGWEIADVYSETISGTGEVARAEYDRLFRDAANPARPWTHLVVWALDRFSRDETFTKATQAILDLERLGIRFHSVKEPMLDTPEDGAPNLGRDVLLALLPVIASFESKRRAERTRLAMAEIKAGRRATRSGAPPGRPWRISAEAVAEAEVLRRGGLAWTSIARRLSLPAASLRSAVYKAKNGLRTYPPAVARQGARSKPSVFQKVE